jgi:hypothetical protein
MQPLFISKIRHHQLIVDADFAKLIHNHRDFLAMLMGENAVEQGGFARAEVASEDGNGNGGCSHDCGLGRLRSTPILNRFPQSDLNHAALIVDGIDQYLRQGHLRHIADRHCIDNIKRRPHAD